MPSDEITGTDGQPGDAEAAETVSFETTRRHYGVSQWRLELESSRRFVSTWSKVASSSLEASAQVRLANVAWAVAGFERSYDLLAENFHRAETAKRDGVPAVMLFLSGPFEGSLDYLLGASLWLNLGEMIAHFRTVVDRFSLLKGSARRGHLLADVAAVEAELSWLRSLTLPALAEVPVTKLADHVLHEAWHPAGSTDLTFPLYFRESGSVDLAEDDLRDQLRALTEAILQRVTTFLLAQATEG